MRSIGLQDRSDRHGGVYAGAFVGAALFVSACGGAAASGTAGMDGAESGGAGGLSWLSWLAGSWVMQDGPQTTSELWTEPRGGVLYGFNFSTAPDREMTHELMRISERDGVLRFTAWPLGQARAEFTASETHPAGAVFENPEHDFPKRIRYTRDGEVLTAAIYGDEEPPAAEWVFERREGVVIRDMPIEVCVRDGAVHFDLGQCYCGATAFGEYYRADGYTDIALVVIDHPCDACESMQATVELPADPGEIRMFGTPLRPADAADECLRGELPVMMAGF